MNSDPRDNFLFHLDDVSPEEAHPLLYPALRRAVGRIGPEKMLEIAANLN